MENEEEEGVDLGEELVYEPDPPRGPHWPCYEWHDHLPIEAFIANGAVDHNNMKRTDDLDAKLQAEEEQEEQDVLDQLFRDGSDEDDYPEERWANNG